jgi:hypothetical protein
MASSKEQKMKTLSKTARQTSILLKMEAMRLLNKIGMAMKLPTKPTVPMMNYQGKT